MTQSRRGELSLELEVYLAGLDPSDVRVEVYAGFPAGASQAPANSAGHGTLPRAW